MTATAGDEHWTEAIGGVEYDVTLCRGCKGTGLHFDPTLADNINGRRGVIHCPLCLDGKDYRITSAGIRTEQTRWQERNS